MRNWLWRWVSVRQMARELLAVCYRGAPVVLTKRGLVIRPRVPTWRKPFV